MKNLKSQHLTMKINEVKAIRLPKSQRLSLVCHQGTLWATAGDSRDYILNAGETMEFESDQEVVVQGLSADVEVDIEIAKSA